MYGWGTKENLDPAVVTVDERRKLCPITQRHIHHHQQQVAVGRKKGSIETKTTVPARLRQATYHGEERANTDPELPPDSPLHFQHACSLGRVQSKTLFGALPPKMDLVTPRPHITVARVQLSVSHHVSPSTAKKKKMSLPLPSTQRRRGEHPPPAAPHMRTRYSFGPPAFPSPF